MAAVTCCSRTQGRGGATRKHAAWTHRFSESTYVETRLEEVLLRDIRERHVRLVILCGNAGDGKTALLQHLARKLGLGKQPSAHRILEGRLADGLRVSMNLDGSAAWRGRSADALLDEFLGPFQNGPPAKDIVHVLAINDGRLLEWVNAMRSATRAERRRSPICWQVARRRFRLPGLTRPVHQPESTVPCRRRRRPTAGHHDRLP